MEKKKKIVHVVEAFGGGVYNFLVDLLNNTIDEFDITVIYALRPQTPDNFINDFDKRIKFIHSKYMTRSIGLNDLKAFFEIKKIIKNENPDIVHCHSSKAGLLTRLAINTKKIKTFYTPHGYSFLMEDSSKLKRFIYKSIEKIGTLNHSVIVACSKGEYEESLKLTKRATYVSNGVNLEILRKYIPDKIKQIDTNNLTFVTTGRVSYQKNPELFNNIAESFPEIKFIWVGTGDLKNKLTRNNIEVTGWKNRDELMEILNKSDVFILPSLWEGLPISLLEAMALKKPCIVSNVIGNRDVISNENNGFVCNNLNEFIGVIKNIQYNKYNLEKISENAFNDIKNVYNTEVMCKKYCNIYKGEMNYG